MNYCKDCKFCKGQFIVFDRQKILLRVCEKAYMNIGSNELTGIEKEIYERNIDLLRNNELKDINGKVRNQIRMKSYKDREIAFDYISEECPFKVELTIQQLNKEVII